MLRREKILIPLGHNKNGLKSLHYAMALAERLKASLYIVQDSRCTSLKGAGSPGFDDTLKEMINSARLAGFSVSHHLATDLEADIVEMVEEEGIDVLVFSADDADCAGIVQRVRPRVPVQIIEVREKDHGSYI